MSPTKRNLSPLTSLPSATDRWVTSRKVALIEAVRSGAITLDEACRRYELSPEEFTGWLTAFETYGAAGLRATRLQIYRDKPTPSGPKGNHPAMNERRFATDAAAD